MGRFSSGGEEICGGGVPNNRNNLSRDLKVGQFKARLGQWGPGVTAMGLYLCSRCRAGVVYVWFRHHDSGLSSGVDELKDFENPNSHVFLVSLGCFDSTDIY